MTWSQLTIALTCLIGLAATTWADDLVKVSLVALPLGANRSATTSAPFVPRESEPCQLVTTIQNRSKDPVLVATVSVTATGYVNTEGKPEVERYSNLTVMADSAERDGDRVKLTVHYTGGHTGWPAGRSLEGCTTGDRSSDFSWISERAALLPGHVLTVINRWLPVTPDGQLAAGVGATVKVLPWSPHVAKAVYALAPGSAVPPRPEWLTASDSPTRQSAPFTLWFAPVLTWSDSTPFDVSIFFRGLAADLVPQAGENRIGLRPGKPALKELLPQINFRPTDCVYSAALDAWFLGSAERTEIIAAGRRVSVRYDAVPFIVGRVFGGRDDQPWEVDADKFATPLAAQNDLATFPRRTGTRTSGDVYVVPTGKILDLLQAVDRRGFHVDESGWIRAPTRD